MAHKHFSIIKMEAVACGGFPQIVLALDNLGKNGLPSLQKSHVTSNVTHKETREQKGFTLPQNLHATHLDRSEKVPKS